MRKLSLFLISLFFAAPCTAATITVDDDGPADFNNIQAAIDDANDGDTVIVADGIYTGPGNRDIDLSKQITVRSENGAANCIIDINASNENPHRAFVVSENVAPVIHGFTITGGYQGYGGAIRSDLYSTEPLIIKDCVFYDNFGMRGGTICIASGGFIITNCTFFNNTAARGGAIDLYSWDETDIVSNCIIWDNEPDDIHFEIDFLLLDSPSPVYPTAKYNVLQDSWWPDPNTNMVVDPCFVDSQGHLGWNSPCINAGDPNYVVGPNDIDMDGQPRKIGPRVDIGADELDPNKPFIKAAPAEFLFEAGILGPDPNDQTLYISNAMPDTCDLNWTITCDCNWLSVEPNNGTSSGEPNEATLSVDITGLPGGVHNCSLTVSDPCAQNNPQTVEVDLSIDGPLIELSATQFEFTAFQGGANPNDQILTISNSNIGTLNWTATPGCDWLTVEPNSGSSTEEPNEVTLGADITDLVQGVYDCNLVISDPNAANSPQIVDVTLTVLGAIIELSTTHLDFVSPVGGPDPNDQILTIRNTGAGILNWQISEDCNWVSALPASGNSIGELDEVVVSVDVGGLEPNFYTCQLTVSDPNAENNPQTVDITLDNRNPLIDLSTHSLDFAFLGDGGVPAGQPLYISNADVGLLKWQISFDCNWASALLLSGTSTGELDEVIVTVDINGLDPNATYTCDMFVTDPNAENNPQIVNITLQPECFPYDNPDYSDWSEAGKPECWCYPRQCHGDADGLKEGSPLSGFWYVTTDDLSVMAVGWMVKDPPKGSGILGLEYQGIPVACADFAHDKEGSGLTGYWRIGTTDLSLMAQYWIVKEPPMGYGTPPDCLPGNIDPSE